MQKKLRRTLRVCLSKIKNPTPNIQQTFSTSKKWILAGCKRPMSHSFGIKHNKDGTNVEDGGARKGSEHHNVTLSDVDRFLFENFRSLYITDDDYDHHEHDDRKGKSSVHDDDDDDDYEDDNDDQGVPGGVLFESSRFRNTPPDLGRIERLFTATRLSGSLTDEARASLTATCEDISSTSMSTSTNTISESLTSSNDDTTKISLPDDSIAVLKNSSDPCRDFQRSMQEMVDAKLEETGKLDWEFMEEILSCFLNLNERKSHKFILNAFVDLVVKMRRDSDKISAKSVRWTRVARERRRLRP